MIHKVERGASSPTAQLLGKLSGAFGLTMSTLIARAEAGSGRLLRRQDQPEWTDPETGYLRRHVTPVSGLPLDLVQVTLPAGQAVPMPAASYAFIRQVIWVLDGALVFEEGRRGTGWMRAIAWSWGRRSTASSATRRTGPVPMPSSSCGTPPGARRRTLGDSPARIVYYSGRLSGGTGMEIREAGPQDIGGILAIYNDAVAHSTAVWNVTTVDAANRAAWLADRQRAGYPVLVAVDAGAAVLGYASFGDWRAFDGYRFTVEHSVYVRADQRGGDQARPDDGADRAGAGDGQACDGRGSRPAMSPQSACTKASASSRPG